MAMIRTGTPLRLLLGGLLLLLPVRSAAVSSMAEGDLLPDLNLPARGGGTASYLGDGNPQVSVFAFVREDQARSREFLDFLPELVQEFAGRAVHWTVILPELSEESATAGLAGRCPSVAVLIDAGDELYGALGLALTPAVGIADAESRLDAYLPYRKVNYQATIRAQISYLLGDIDQEGLQAVLEPVKAGRDSAEVKARRDIKLARILLSRGKIAQAKSRVDSVLEICPDLAEAYELLAEIHHVEGNLAGARAAAERARSLAGPEDSG